MEFRLDTSAYRGSEVCPCKPSTLGSIATPEADFAATLEKYAAECKKRLRPDGATQYADIALSDKLKHFAEDPWIRGDENQRQNPYLSQPAPVANGGKTKVVITGAGFSALTFAVRLIQTVGFKADDFVFVDSAWGFGGTWYWNRYPGLMCDVESACYLPLLDEIEYIPKHRYSYGPELRHYVDLLVEKYGFQSRPLFGSTIKESVWSEDSCEWSTTVIRKHPIGNSIEETYVVRSDFVILASGFLNRPKLPRLPGLDVYGGHMFHTSRWDYEYTGGSPEDPTLSLLRGKRVAFLGTGATGIQVVPQLARWAGEVFVFQRTPSAVDVRGQKEIDPEEWRRDVTLGRSRWQQERRDNMAAFISRIPDLPAKNMVDDGWTNFPSYSAVLGGPAVQSLTATNVAEYAETLNRLDLQRQERIRQRVDAVVKDPVTAESLKPWYQGWCKRPCFHDDYLDAFNEPNVHLVDTGGKGIDGFSPRGVRFNGQEYDVDVVILGTGFEAFSASGPAFRARIEVKGRDGVSLDDKWKKGAGTLHGVLSHGFPNLVLTGFAQAGTAVNAMHIMDVLASHTARIIAAAQEHAGSSKRPVLEPTFEAEEAWAVAVAGNAYAYAAVSGCTPGYINGEGAWNRVQTPEEQIKAARSIPWGRGMLDYLDILAAWHKGDRMSDLHVRGAA
ncbi:flavin-binding monooxygenase-like family protein [Aspergillus steynii IBT 23096]|uniref:Flavin-binding monooxygenase-like family protein n=1 Tax=Aspergillus steynii IBT 23096 TaxID=1392250 RepID=A0A2I2FW95_9EURO|nr:flavin-binding monooxygenase-like family protein [Aspergillus steynii IBT 23096]PLB44912.1 flavin-binding monooxygenase-like family protein [Aspergillus steynii IBT 23096]